AVAPTSDHNSKTDRNTIAESVPPEAAEFKPRLIVVSGMMLGLQIELGDKPVTIGRASECALSLQHPSVSRHHCEISRDGERYFIEDLGSTNRTYLNGKPVRREELHDGDQISVGNNAIKFFTGHSLEAKYHDELIDLAIYDSLTGFYNRRHFHTLLDEEIERAKGAPVSVLMMDLDHFKNINDRFGHLVGDQVLTSAAQIMRTQAPADAPFGRLGGEEFALALGGKTVEEAIAVAEKLRDAIASKPIETRDQKLPITISIGVAQTNEKLKTGAELLNNADDRLYRAKQAGRNCVWAKD
ncbi:MAG TPA: GGDEF domain-containing protein, partial [Rudaea sp.]|nr:GGDEF domain-containing protein [Rudaea sp.]